MNINDILKIAGAFLVSLGGGAAIITAVVKWASDFLAKTLLSNIEAKHEKEIANYKTELNNMSTKFSSLVNHSVNIATKQYDMEVDIYRNIWKHLYELSVCIKYFDNFSSPIGSNPEEYKKKLEENCMDLKNKLMSFQQQVDSFAPFYQSDIYELLCQIYTEFDKLLVVFNCSIGVLGISSENEQKTKTDILPRIKDLNQKLTNVIRDYLFSLKKIPGKTNIES